jgi:hypothetical protein
VVFTALLTDPDGVQDIVGGTLRGPDEAIYGNFVQEGQTGSFVLNLSWDEVNAVHPLTFDATGQDRKLSVRFFDQAGHSVEQNVNLSFACDGAGARSGVCEALLPGEYVLTEVFVFSNACNVQTVGLLNSTTQVEVDGRDVKLFDYIKVEEDDDVIDGYEAWSVDWKPNYNCVEQYEQEYAGEVYSISSFEFELVQRRWGSGDPFACGTVASTQGVTFPCESRIRVVLDRLDDE